MTQQSILIQKAYPIRETYKCQKCGTNYVEGEECENCKIKLLEYKSNPTSPESWINFL